MYCLKHLALYFLLLFFIQSPVSLNAQHNRIALLDLTARNTETTNGNLFSAEHLLKVSGLPYFVTDSVTLATQSNFVLVSSTVESFSFTSAERDSLRNFVNRGGTLFIAQLKDTALFDLFGVYDYTYSTSHYTLNWLYNAADKAFRWVDDVNEKQMKLADTSYSSVMGSRSYMLSTAVALAKFDDDSVAVCKNQYGLGNAYVLGLNWKDVFLRNQVMASYKASRTYSNDFEPGSDVFILLMRALYAKHNPYAVWKHTSGLNSKSTFVITHDVDATSSIKNIMNDFASYEENNNIKATYFVTTHYMHDSIAKDFWNGYTDEIMRVKEKGHEIGSHSVSHVPDFDNETIVPEGSCGNNEITYQPFYNGTYSSNVTVCGETEVSKLLLERDINVSIHSFRAGYLAYNEKILNSLQTNNYSFNSSHSANDVLTAFPFQGHLDLSMSGAVSSIYEIPNTISDVFKSDPISIANYNDKVSTWLNVIQRNAANNAPTVLLIHPNRVWKLLAEQNLLRALPSSTRIVPFEQFGNFWKAREACDFDYTLTTDSTLLITIKNSAVPLHHDLSFVVNDGMLLHSITVEDESHNVIPLFQEQWEGNDKILYSEKFNQQYTDFYYVPNGNLVVFDNYPNPFSTSTTITFEVMSNNSDVTLSIYDATGRLVDEPVAETLEIGRYTYTYSNSHLTTGLYFYAFTVNGSKAVVNKMIVK